MEATSTAIVPDAAGAPEEPAAPRHERLAWAFPIGCAVVAAAGFFGTRAIAPPAEPPYLPDHYALTPMPFLETERAPLPLPFISPFVITPSYYVPRAELPKRFGLDPAAGAHVSLGAPMVSGRLPPEVVSRVVRQHRGRFRACYEAGLRNNPNLVGRVSVRFLIGRDGAVGNVANGGSDLPDGSVVRCVAQAMGRLNFPQPEGGIVSVVYPIALRPG